MVKPKKSIALILSLFVMVVLISFVSISTYQYLADLRLQNRYENSLQVLYLLEAGRVACIWEERHAGVYYYWDTDPGTSADSICKLAGSFIDGDNFYKLQGYNFKAKTFSSAGGVHMYIHAFGGKEEEPQYSKYLEFIHSPAPMYQYVMFTNTDMHFYGDKLINCKGGKIHSNGDIKFEFWDRHDAIRLANLGELSAAGTIKYRYNRYMPPHYFDEFDAVDANGDGRIDRMEKSSAVDGMAPAPYPFYPHYRTTTGSDVKSGPFRWWNGSRWTWKYTSPYPGYYLGGDWGSWGSVPFAWRGEESYFRGRQYLGSGALRPEYTEKYLYKDGGTTGSRPSLREAGRVHIFELADNNDYTFTVDENKDGRYYIQGGVYFSPHKDKKGNLNNGSLDRDGDGLGDVEWFQIPGALPEDYVWDYKYGGETSREIPVKFYATQPCKEESPGCIVNKYNNPSISRGWRYIRKDSEGHICEDDACYNGDASVYIPLEEYVDPEYGSYLSHIRPLDHDKNEEFFDDFRYGDDVNDSSSSYRVIRAFNSRKQPGGFAEYLRLLSEEGYEGVINSEAEEKKPFTGYIFDTYHEDGTIKENSPYKFKARKRGIYIDSDNIDNVVYVLNTAKDGQSLPDRYKVARKVTFYHWRTNRPVSLIDINIRNLRRRAGLSGNQGFDFNGIIYAKFPVRLSNAENLPGRNTSDKKAVFTVASEESVYLKGDYNTRDWKISNIATKKQIYALSNAFTDPEITPDFGIYPEYPYVYVKKDKKGNYLPEEGNPGFGNGEWINAYTVDDKETGKYIYYEGMDKKTRDWVEKKMKEKQAQYEGSGIKPPNRVDKPAYRYYSLFITPYEGAYGDEWLDTTLENWYYLDGPGREKRGRLYMIGAFINLYDRYNSEYDEEYRSALSPEETEAYYECDYRVIETDNRLPLREFKTAGITYSLPWNFNWLYNYGIRGSEDASPVREISYDSRFPRAHPADYGTVLGLTQADSWRLITKEYFEDKTSPN